MPRKATKVKVVEKDRGFDLVVGDETVGKVRGEAATKEDAKERAKAIQAKRDKAEKDAKLVKKLRKNRDLA